MYTLVPTINVISNPVGMSVDGSTNTFDYPILSSVTLMCMVDPLPVVNVSYSWNTTRCYTNSDYNDGVPGCFPHNQTTQSVTDTDLTAEDAGTVACIATFNNRDYPSKPLTLRISGE